MTPRAESKWLPWLWPALWVCKILFFANTPWGPDQPLHYQWGSASGENSNSLTIYVGLSPFFTDLPWFRPCLHVAEFAMLVILLFVPMHRLWPAGKTVATASLVAMAFAGIYEGLQKSGWVADVLFDGVGVILGAAILLWWARRQPARQP